MRVQHVFLRGLAPVVGGLFVAGQLFGNDPFSASSKMLGPARFGSPPATTETTGPDAADSNVPVPQTLDNRQASSPFGVMQAAEQQPTHHSVMRRPSEPTGVQEIFPAAQTGNDRQIAMMANQQGDSGTSGGGLKTLQQRFANLRKFAGAKPDDNEPAEQNARPQSPPQHMQGAHAPRGNVVGTTTGGPVPPQMPDIRQTQPTPAHGAPMARQVVPSGDNRYPPIAGNAMPTAAGPAETPAAPVTSSRRMPAGQGGSDMDNHEPATVRAAVEPTRADGFSSRRTPDANDARPAPIIAGAVSAQKPEAPRNSNVLFTRQSPVLSVETTGPRSITIGKEATYVVTLNNSGDAAAQDVKVTVRIPAWTEVMGATATSGSAQPGGDDATQPLTWQVPRLEAKAKEQLTLRLVPRESRPFDLAVQWTFSPVTSQAMVEVKEPKLAMSVAGPEEILFGDTKVYKLSLVNPGTGDAENVVLFLSPVDGGAGSPTRHEIGAIAAGETKIVEVELAARQAGMLAIKGAAVADGNLRAEAAQDVLVRRAGLKVAAAGPDLKFAGTPATFNIMVANPGNATAESVQVAALLPAGSKYVASSGGQFIAEQNKVVWTLPSIRSSGEHELEVRCVLHSPGANRLQVVALADSDLSDSTAMNVNVEALADLKLEVADPNGPIAVGDEVTYEVKVRNRGTKAAEGVVVAGFFSGGLEPTTAHGGDHELAAGQVVFKPIASLAPGAEVTMKIKAKAEQSGNHLFRAEVNCETIGMKLAAEETTLFYGAEMTGTSRLATKPTTGGSTPQPMPQGEPAPGRIVR